MNRRKAKKKVKRLTGIREWPGNLEPRTVLQIYRYMVSEYGAMLDHAILYGASKPFVSPVKKPPWLNIEWGFE